MMLFSIASAYPFTNTNTKAEAGRAAYETYIDGGFSSELHYFHTLASLYHWSYVQIEYETPVYVLKSLSRYINHYTKKGYLSHFELMMTKALARIKGVDFSIILVGLALGVLWLIK